MVGWISIVLLAGFLLFLVKVLIESVLDISASLTGVTLIVLSTFILSAIYLDSTLVLVISTVFLLGIFIKQRIL